MKMLGIGAVTALAMAALACGKATPDTSTLQVTGAVDTKTQALDNASAVAIGSDGRTFSAYLQKDGRFTLALPVGHVYRILIANSTMNGELRPIGHLVNPTSSGRSDVIAVRDGGTMNLGTLRPAGSASNTVHTACDCSGTQGGDDSGSGKDDEGEESGDDKDGKDDDHTSHQKDDDKDRVCEGSTDVELEADHAPGEKCAKGEGDEDAPKPKAKACSTKDSDKDGKDDDDDDDTSGGSASGSTGGDGSSPNAPGSCTCSKQCGAGSSCNASKCTADTSTAPSAPTPPK